MKYCSQFLIALLMFVGVQTITLAQTELASIIQDGQHVLLMRHADAPGYGVLRVIN
jgi:hypothetical protein